MDIFRKDDGSTVIEGRRKIYSTKTPMKLLLPNGKDDGVLDKGDLIYVMQKTKSGDKDLFRFMVLKFAETDKQKKVYSGDSQYFKQYFDKTSNADGENTEESKDKKINYKVPLITGVGVGAVCYLLANKFQKNALAFGIGGLVVGAIIGHYIININKANTKK